LKNMNILDHLTDENNENEKKLPEGFKGVASEEPKEKKPFRYKKGTEIAKKPNTIYLDIDVMEALDRNVSMMKIMRMKKTRFCLKVLKV